MSKIQGKRRTTKQNSELKHIKENERSKRAELENNNAELDKNGNAINFFQTLKCGGRGFQRRSHFRFWSKNGAQI